MPESENITEQERVQKREKYRTWITRTVGIGVTGFFIANVVWWITEAPLALYAGLGIYWLGCLGMGIGYWASPVLVRDEFEQHILWEASQATYTFITAVAIIGIPADVVLSVTGTYTAPAALRGAIWAYLLLIFVFGAAHWYVGRQYS